MALLEMQDLKTFFTTKRGVVKAVNGVSYKVEAGKTLGVVGESGSGKSVSAMSMLQLLDGNGYIAGGSIMFDGRDLTKLSLSEMQKIRGNAISVIFQEPMTSLNPVFTIERQVSEPFHPSKRWPPSMNEVRGLAALLCQRPRPPRTESIEVDSRTPSTVL